MEGRSSATKLSDNPLLARLRDKLNSEVVKLWLYPFYDEKAKVARDSEILALASRYASELDASEHDVAVELYSLQNNALNRLEEKDLFKETGLATLRIKYSGASFENCTIKEEAKKFHVDLSVTNGEKLKEHICNALGDLSPNRLKLICSGRVIKDDLPLSQQRVVNGSQVLVILIAGTSDFIEEENELRQMEQAKNDANYLASKDLTDMYSLQVADQTGAVLDLPDFERKALAVALAMHEKGRAALFSKQYSKALIYLLEADTNFSECQSSMLEHVDNYGILNLDIAWCYLCLQSISELPFVEARLNESQKALEKSYGPNMERVMGLKGAYGWEAGLFVRLHLLQAIAAYHLGQVEKSKFYIGKVEDEISKLTVNDGQLAQLVGMGYDENDSRMALRSTFGNMIEAVDWLIRKKAESEDVKKKEREKLKSKRLQRLIGNCSNGDPVNISVFESMKQMGFNQPLSCAALQRCNNDIDAAIQLVNDETFISEVINNMISKKKNRQTNKRSKTAENQDEAKNEKPGPSRAVNAVTSESGSNIVGSSKNLSTTELIAKFLQEDLSDMLRNVGADEQDIEKSQKAYDNVKKDMKAEEEYIDLKFEEEIQYLTQYKGLLNI